MKQSNDSTLEFYKYYDIPEEKTREIKPSKKIISAYDLYKMLEHEITGLDIELNQLLDSMHTYCKYNSSLLRKVFHKNQEEAIIPKCNGINFENKDHKMIINLYKFPNPGNRAVPEIKIIYYPKNDILKILGTPQKFLSYYYNYGYDFFKIKNKEDIECIEAHLNEIRNICLSSFWGKPQVWRDNQIERLLNSINISDDIFSVEFKYDKETNTLTPKIKNKRVNIPENNIDIIELILKQIPIHIPGLSQEVQDLIHTQRYKSRKQLQETTNIKTKKVKQKKKIFSNH